MFITTTGTVVAQLTRKGRQILAENSAAFNITGFRFSDDEVNYAFFDGSTIDAPNYDLSNWPVLEGCSNGEYTAGQRYTVFSADNSLVSLANLETDIGYIVLPDNPFQQFYAAANGQGQIASSTNIGSAPFSIGKQENRIERSSADIFIEYDSAIPGQEWNFTIKTFYGNDNAYLVSFKNTGQSFKTGGQPFTVNGGNQTIFQSIPDTDPTQTTQNQSQATITFKLAGDFISSGGTIFAPDNTHNPYALGNMQIVGQQTGQRFDVRIWLWSRSLVLSQRGTVTVDCPTGYHLGGDGQCIPDNPPVVIVGGDSGGCPTGYHKDGSGNCVPDIIITPGQCPDGYIRDASGNCVPSGGGTWRYFNTCTQKWQNFEPSPNCYQGRKIEI